MDRANSGVRSDKMFDRAMRGFAGKALEFLIRLAQTDPEAIASGQPGDLPNLIFGLYGYRFLVMSPEDRKAHHEADEIDRLTEMVRRQPELLRPVIKSAGALLAAAADGGRFQWKLAPASILIFDGGLPGPSSLGESGQRLMLSDGKALPAGLEQAVVVQTMQYLNTESGAMMRRCARSPSCQRIFLAARPKQVFCSRQCAASAAFERHKLTPGYGAKHKKTARESYRKRRREQGHEVKERVKGDKVWKGPKGA